MDRIFTVAEHSKTLDKDAKDAYTEWVRLDHQRLSAVERGTSPHYAMEYLKERANIARQKYERLRAYADERRTANLAFIREQVCGE
jgi:hypothetical protein